MTDGAQTRRWRIWGYMRDHQKQHGEPAELRAVARHVGVSLQTVHTDLLALEVDGRMCQGLRRSWFAVRPGEPWPPLVERPADPSAEGAA